MTKNVYMIGGPNGAGKTTAAMKLLPDFLSVNEFVNADNIARGLSPFNQDAMAVAAGKLMIKRMNDLIKEGKDFAFETTCAGKNHAKTIEKCRENGYKTNLIFLWLPSVEMSIKRVASRVANGGHNIPEETIRRRYKSGLNNLVNLYVPLFDNVTVYDNSLLWNEERELIIDKVYGVDVEVINSAKWKLILEG